jgi:branched-chain amino acid transport system substrate-binding protein
MSEQNLMGGRLRRVARLGTAVTAVTAAATLLAACGSTTPPSGGGDQSGPIKVGALQSVTGPLAVYGLTERHAFEVAIDEVNKNGGIDGRKVELVFYDPAGDTSKAVDLTRRMLQQDQVDIVVGGGTSSGIALAMKPILQSAGVYFMSTEAADPIVAPASESPLTFATTLSTDIVTRSMFEHLKAAGVTKAGILGDSTAYGQAGVESAEKAAKDTGVELVSGTYDPAATDLTPDINRLTDGGAQAWINWTSGTSGVVFMKNAATLKLTAKGTVMASFTYSNPELMVQAGDAAKGVVVAGVKAAVLDSLAADDPQRESLRALADELKSRDNEPVTIYASQSYDAMMVALKSVDEADTTEGKAVAKATEGMTFQGTQGEYRFSADDHRGLDTSVPIIMSWDGSGFVVEGKGD